MLTAKEKLVIWLLAIVNPIVCWSVAYLFWLKTDQEKYQIASQASLTVIVLVVGLALLSFLL